MSFIEGLNKSIAHAAVVIKDPETAELRWHDGSPLSSPRDGREPPPLMTGHLRKVCQSPADKAAATSELYRFDEVHRELSKSFTTAAESPGVVYRPLFDYLMAESIWQHASPVTHLSKGLEGRKGQWRHKVVPAFFRTLTALQESQLDFLLCLRTMGSDLPAMAKTLKAFASGLHPQFSQVGTPEKPAEWAQMSCVLQDGSVHYRLHHGPRGLLRHPLTNEEAEDHEFIGFFETMAHPSRVIGVQDDYQFWRASHYAPQCGKPVWYTESTAPHVFHIFFDDNIHDKADDSIVSVRARRHPTDSFHILSGEEILQYLDVMLVKVNIIDAILDEYYFLKLIQQCLQKYDLLTHALPI